MASPFLVIGAAAPWVFILAALGVPFLVIWLSR
jgi:hypothetical protein